MVGTTFGTKSWKWLRGSVDSLPINGKIITKNEETQTEAKRGPSSRLSVIESWRNPIKTYEERPVDVDFSSPISQKYQNISNHNNNNNITSTERKLKNVNRHGSLRGKMYSSKKKRKNEREHLVERFSVLDSNCTSLVDRNSGFKRQYRKSLKKGSGKSLKKF